MLIQTEKLIPWEDEIYHEPCHEMNEHYTEPYHIKEGCLYKTVVNAASYRDIKLCNFVPYLESDFVLDDGVDTVRYLKIGGVLCDGTMLPSVTMSVQEFNAMNWVTEKWGTKCNIEAGQSMREHLRHAIQSTSIHVENSTVYAHSGFRKIDGALRYLLDGMELTCETHNNVLRNYHFPIKLDKLNIDSSYKLLLSKLAPPKILYPLVVFQFLAPLTHLLNFGGHMPKTVLVLVGRTGSKKSSLSALMLSHFGDFTFDTLPLSFRDTGNSIVERLHTLKDLPTVIDDFHPSAGGYEEVSMMKNYQLVMRAFGDNTARASLTQSRELRDAKPPRGIGIITAEFIPTVSESGLARSLQV